MTKRRGSVLSLATIVFATHASAQVNIDAVVGHGKDLYNAPASCAVCHRETGEGLIGPDIRYGPTPAQILEQLINNPQMAVIEQELKPDNEDLIAIAMYIRSLGGMEIDEDLIIKQRLELITARAQQQTDLIFPKTARDEAVEQIQTWDSVVADWQRRSKEGPLVASYESQVVKTFDPGKPKFKPKKGKTYFYENVGNSANLAILEKGATNAKSTQVVVGDAKTHKVIASYELPVSLRAAVHATVMSPDGKFVYIVGSKPESEPTNQMRALDAPATLINAIAARPGGVARATITSESMNTKVSHGAITR